MSDYAKLHADRDRFLSHIDGMLFGPDPQQGYFEDGVFLHPALKFRFSLPQGWQTANQTQQVILAEPNGQAQITLAPAQGNSIDAAAKAFLSVEIARWVAAEGLSLDVCSGGELAVALRAGFPPERIALHGNNKSPAELAAALDAGVGRIVVDSFHEIARLDALATQRDTVVDVLLRATVGVEAHTHEFIATAHEDQKFGFSIADGKDSGAAVRPNARTQPRSRT